MPLYDSKGRIPMAGIAHLFMYWNGHAIQACALEESDMSNSVIERTVMPCREKPSAIIGLPLNGELYSAIVFKRRLLLQSVGDISKSLYTGQSLSHWKFRSILMPMTGCGCLSLSTTFCTCLPVGAVFSKSSSTRKGSA
jgi:hypothetical protein